jgi:hypothetical protein
MKGNRSDDQERRGRDVGQITYARIVCGQSNPSELYRFDSYPYPLDRTETSFGGARNFSQIR